MGPSGESPDVVTGSVQPGRVRPASSRRRIGDVVVVVLAGLLHAVLGVTVMVSGLIMPVGAVYVLGMLWIAGVVVMIGARGRPAFVSVVPIASWILWFVVVWVGDMWWGWSA